MTGLLDLSQTGDPVRGSFAAQLRGMSPLAIVLNSVNPILAQGAALGDLPMLAGFDVDITAAIPRGAEVEVDPERRTLTVVR
jgi:predicted aconitase with swiveling domain